MLLLSAATVLLLFYYCSIMDAPFLKGAVVAILVGKGMKGVLCCFKQNLLC
jgi:hypothetical protein